MWLAYGIIMNTYFTEGRDELPGRNGIARTGYTISNELYMMNYYIFTQNCEMKTLLAFCYLMENFSIF